MLNLDNCASQQFSVAKPQMPEPVAPVMSTRKTGLQHQEKLASFPATVSVVTQTREDRRHSKQPLTITYGTGRSWFGDCLIAATDQGICWLDIKPGVESLEQLQEVWAPQRLLRDDQRASLLADNVFAEEPDTFALHLCGTEFQLRVWRALLQIVPGHYMNYGQLAACIEAPGAARAVGGAVGANGVAVLVPCHRVLPRSARLGGYRWGIEHKAALLQRELSASIG
jgi:AraC family transcriptional regulator of adaptative response/methylated-DNA-[protein]-cysteine methyltransferase